jgi:hypothetical protein
VQEERQPIQLELAFAKGKDAASAHTSCNQAQHKHRNGWQGAN